MAETATATEAKITVGFGMLPLEAILPSGTNPRKTFDPKSMEDLTASIKEKGVLQPILVRFMPRQQQGGTSISEHYELVAGERRWRAAKKAGLTEIPAVVRELTTDQALEAQVIENLQRTDVHPLEEAEGYKTLLARKRHTVESLSQQVSKSVSYIWQRIKLTELIEPAKKAFLEDRITAGHAVLIARLTPADQKEALDTCFDEVWLDGKDHPTLLSVRSLATWIKDNIHLSLDGAPWRKDDPELVEAAGPCTTCPKRAGNSPSLWPEILRANVCTDRGCYQSKLDAWTLVQKKELEAKGERVERITEDYQPREKGLIGSEAYRIAAKNKKRCPETIKGIYANGGKRGQVVDICVGENCRVHRGATFSHGPTRNSAEQKERTKEILKERATERARLAILGEILKATKSLTRADLEIVACGFNRYVYMAYELTEAEFAPIEVNGPDDCTKASDKDLARYIVAAALNRELRLVEDPNLLYATAKRHKIDVKAIEKKSLEAVVYERAHKDRMQRWKGLKAAGNTRFDIMTCQLCGRTEVEQSKGGWHWIRKNDKSKVAVCSDCDRLEKK